MSFLVDIEVKVELNPNRVKFSLPRNTVYHK